MKMCLQMFRRLTLFTFVGNCFSRVVGGVFRFSCFLMFPMRINPCGSLPCLDEGIIDIMCHAEMFLVCVADNIPHQVLLKEGHWLSSFGHILPGGQLLIRFTMFPTLMEI